MGMETVRSDDPAVAAPRDAWRGQHRSGSIGDAEQADAAGDTPALRVVRDPDAWQALWTGTIGRPPPRALASGEIGIAILLGQRSSGGYRIDVPAIVATGSERIVVWIERPPEGMAGAVITHPWWIGALPADPSRPIRFATPGGGSMDQD